MINLTNDVFFNITKFFGDKIKNFSVLLLYYDLKKPSGCLASKNAYIRNGFGMFAYQFIG